MKLHNNIKPIVVTTLAIGFFLLAKWQFPIYKVNGNAMLGDYFSGEYLLVSKLHAIEPGDVVVYEYQGKVRLSRVVGLHGDQVEGVDGDLKLNGEELHFTNERYGYYVYCDTTVMLKNINGYQEIYPKREYFALLSQEEQTQLNELQGVLKVEKQIYPSKGATTDSSSWSRDNFGPIVLPKTNELFLMNDNRVNRFDSRTFGAIQQEQIMGKVLFKL